METSLMPSSDYSGDLPNGSVPYGLDFGNGTGWMVRHDKTLFIEILSRVYLITLPIICVTGVIGNVLAFFVFISKPLRRTSCSWYLAARSFSDGGFLFATFLTWLSDASKLKFFHTEGLCQIIVFMTYVFAFLSVWLTVVVTSENYIRICRPFSVQRFCNVIIARWAILILVIVGLALYNYPFWTSKVFVNTHTDNKTYYWCASYAEYAHLLKWLSFVDMLATLVVPSLLIIVLMVAITFSLIKSLKRQSRLQAGTARNARANGQSSGLGGGRSQRSNSSPQAKVTRMLFAVSFFFIILNGPLHMIRMKMAVVEFFGASQQTSPTVEEQVHVVFQIIYYLSFAVNLIIYLTCGDNFRKQFKETYFSLCIQHRSPRGCSEMTAMSTVKMEEIDTCKAEEQTALIENGTNKDGGGGNTS